MRLAYPIRVSRQTAKMAPIGEKSDRDGILGDRKGKDEGENLWYAFFK